VAALTIANHARTTAVIALAMIAALSIVQLNALAPRLVYADNNPSVLAISNQPISTDSNMTQPVLQITPSMESITAGGKISSTVFPAPAASVAGSH
jgi:hypothetical protein